jgi:outer membrane protein assembly factor BamD
MNPATCNLARITAAAFISVLMLAGCGRKDDIVQGPDALYERAEKSLGNGNYANAIFYLEQLEARYPFSNVSKQAQLDLIYAYYKNVEPESAGDAADQFMRENPTHPRVDYCLYMKGVIFFDQDANFLEKLFRVDLSERPPRNTMRAFTAFQELLRRFPDSEYAPDGRDRMIYLRNRLAEYENHVADYYIERQAYVAAANRAKFAVENFPGAPALEESLNIMIKAYKKLGMVDLANDAQRVLRETFGDGQLKTSAR